MNKRIQRPGGKQDCRRSERWNPPHWNPHWATPVPTNRHYHSQHGAALSLPLQPKAGMREVDCQILSSGNIVFRKIIFNEEQHMETKTPWPVATTSAERRFRKKGIEWNPERGNHVEPVWNFWYIEGVLKRRTTGSNSEVNDVKLGVKVG